VRILVLAQQPQAGQPGGQEELNSDVAQLQNSPGRRGITAQEEFDAKKADSRIMKAR
jgi:hypothetical protein